MAPLDKALSTAPRSSFPMSEQPPGRPDPLLPHTNASIVVVITFVIAVIALVARTLYGG